jgi:hypothetical protein
MPATSFSPQQREWGAQFLQVLGKRPAEDEDMYGEGYTEVDPRPLHADLQTAVTSGAMITADKWNKATMGPTTAEKADFKTNRDAWTAELAKMGQVAKDKNALHTKWLKLKNAKDNGAPWPCDIGPPEGAVPGPPGDAARLAKWAEYETKKTELTACNEARKKLMPFADAPENNPERIAVGKRLRELEEIDQKLGRPNGLTPEQHNATKCKKLFELQRDLFEWNDRRTRQHLPPSSEALAMADMLQKAHQDMTQALIDNPTWEVTVADSDQLSEEEKAHVQELWKHLRDDTDTTPGAKLVVSRDARGPVGAGEVAEFRRETLSNFIRMMGSEGGRHILDRLNSGAHKVTVRPQEADKGAACARIGSGQKLTGLDAHGGKIKGTGGKSAVSMVFRAKDSSKGLATREGTTLFAPRFIAMGHELIHATHNQRGTNRVDEQAPEDPLEWDNLEEYRTISAATTSEQVLRQQYGLSAERYSHSPVDPGAPVAAALTDLLAAQDALNKPGNTIERTLRNYAWDPDHLDIPLRVKLAELIAQKKAPVAPLPQGWKANELTAEQIAGIIEKGIPFKLRQLGWAPFGLTVERIKTITDTNEHHPKSPLHRLFVRLGGAAALGKIGPFNAATGSKLSAGKPADWPSQPRALEDAQNFLTAVAAINPALATAATTKGKLEAKLEAVTVAVTGGAAGGGSFKDQAIEQFWAKIPAPDLARLETKELAAKYSSGSGFAMFGQLLRVLEGVPKATPAAGKPAADKVLVMKQLRAACQPLEADCTKIVTEWIDPTAADRLKSNFRSNDPADDFKKGLKKDVTDLGRSARAILKALRGVEALTA